MRESNFSILQNIILDKRQMLHSWSSIDVTIHDQSVPCRGSDGHTENSKRMCNHKIVRLETNNKHKDGQHQQPLLNDDNDDQTTVVNRSGWNNNDVGVGSCKSSFEFRDLASGLTSTTTTTNDNDDDNDDDDDKHDEPRHHHPSRAATGRRVLKCLWMFITLAVTVVCRFGSCLAQCTFSTLRLSRVLL